MSTTDPHDVGPAGPIYGNEPPVTARLDEVGGGVARAVAGLGRKIGLTAEPQDERALPDDYDEDYPEDILHAAWDEEYEGDESDGYDDEDAYEYGEWTEEELAAFHAASGETTIGRIGAYAGALSSVALVVGLGLWGYDLAMRDLNGVPVVAALEGPHRVAPEDPEGMRMAHQGLAVNGVQAEGVVAPAPDSVALAPSSEDIAPQDVAEAEPEDDGLLDIDFAETDLTDPDVAAALAEEMAAVEEPIFEVQETSAPLGPQVIAATVPGVAESPRPPIRPTSLAARQAEPITDVQTTSANTTREADPAAVTPGTHLVQVGAFPTAELARTEWDRLTGKFGAYFEGKDRLVIEASSGGRSFFRLRAMGFDDMAQARAFCSALIAGNADCIPVVSR